MPSSNATLADDFRDCIDALNGRKVNFVLVGAYALGWHGVVRATGDIDFLYEQTKRNVAALCVALSDFGAPPHLIDEEFLLSPNAITQIGLEPLRIDLLAAISGVTFDEVRRGAIEVEVEGRSLLVIGMNELRRNKGATGRAKDREDLRRLDALPQVRSRRPKKKS
ncbi:MAG: nucleotidyl transferase AbiEii/AbiGii toxin family protein [bacterium]